MSALVRVGRQVGPVQGAGRGRLKNGFPPSWPSEPGEWPSLLHVANGSVMKLLAETSPTTAESGKFSRSEEQAFTLADEKIVRRFGRGRSRWLWRRSGRRSKSPSGSKTGKGLGWHEHHPELSVATELFFRPGDAANLINSWIPWLEAVKKNPRKVLPKGCRPRPGRVHRANGPNLFRSPKFFVFLLSRQVY